MSVINSAIARNLFLLLTVGFLAAACGTDTTGPSQGTKSRDGSPSVQSDSTQPAFGWRGG
jgi:hypothetical protein